MRYFIDYEGNRIRLTDERAEHILLHKEMIEFQDFIGETLHSPDYVLQSKADENVKLYNKFYYTNIYGNKFLCVVVKFIENDIFIITAYIINKIQNGEILWRKK